MVTEKRTSISLPADLYAVAKAVANYQFGIFQPWPNGQGEDDWRTVRLNTIGDALAWFAEHGMPHAFKCVNRELERRSLEFTYQRQIGDFFLGNPAAEWANRSEFPEDS